MEIHKIAKFLYFLSFCLFPTETYSTGWFVSQHGYIFHASESLTPLRDFPSKVISWIRACHVFLDSRGQRAMIFLCRGRNQGIVLYILLTPCLWVGAFSSNGFLFLIPARYVNLSMWYTCQSIIFSSFLFASQLKIFLFLRGLEKLASVPKLKFHEYLVSRELSNL